MSAFPHTEALADDFLMEVPRQLWTYRQVADWLQVSVRTVERMVAEGRLQCIRISEGCVRFDPRKVVGLADEPALAVLPDPTPPPTAAPARPRLVRSRKPKPAPPSGISFRARVRASQQ